MVFKQKPRKAIMFTANPSINTQAYCQSTKESICYNILQHTHDEDPINHPQILKITSDTHTKWIFNRGKNIMKFIKSNKKFITETKH